MLVITGEGLKTLDAVRGTFTAHEIAPSLRRVRREVESQVTPRTQVPA